jgi:hypothetical protein
MGRSDGAAPRVVRADREATVVTDHRERGEEGREVQTSTIMLQGGRC